MNPANATTILAAILALALAGPPQAPNQDQAQPAAAEPGNSQETYGWSNITLIRGAYRACGATM